MRLRIWVVLVISLLVAGGAVTAAVAGGNRGGERKGHGHARGWDRHWPGDLPDRLDLPDGWQPEGIAADRTSLYVGSIPTGAVLRLNPRTGETETVVQGAAGRAAIGLKVDGKRLVVAGGATGKAFIYDARGGELLAQPQLSQPGAETFVNDVVLTRAGAYFTDSRRRAIYRVGGDGSVQTIELPAVPNEAGNNLNGIVAADHGKLLLAVQTNAGRLWRIDPSSGQATQVDLGGATLVNGDGMLLAGRTLYVLRNRTNELTVVRLSPDFTSGAVVTTIKSAGFDVPSTLTALKGELYAVNARFGTAGPQPADYWVTLVRR